MQVSDAAPSVPSPAKVAGKAQVAAKAIPSPSETASAVTISTAESVNLIAEPCMQVSDAAPNVPSPSR